MTKTPTVMDMTSFFIQCFLLLTFTSLFSTSESKDTASSSLRVVNIDSRYDPFSNVPLQRLFRRSSIRNGDDDQMTTITDISTALDHIEIHWNFIISSSEVPQKEVQWLVRVREFGQNARKVTRMIATVSPPETKDYLIRVDELIPGTPYEACVHTLNHSLTKKPHVMHDINYGCHYGIDMMCFEVITKSEKTNVAVASAISSASTFVIVVLCFCCCVPRKAKKDKKDVEGRRAYFQITNLMSSKDPGHQQVDGHDTDHEEVETPPETPTTPSSSSTLQAGQGNQTLTPTDEAKRAVSQAVSNNNPDFIEYYIDPKDISLIHDPSRVKIFSK